MQYLIDTHVYLWFLSNNRKLSPIHAQIISQRNTKLYFSYVSIWEIVIKASKGKLELQTDIKSFVEYTEKLGIRILNLETRDFEVLSTLPFFHFDPFDRLLISQTKSRDLTLLTSDYAIQKYNSQILIK